MMEKFGDLEQAFDSADADSSGRLRKHEFIGFLKNQLAGSPSFPSS